MKNRIDVALRKVMLVLPSALVLLVRYLRAGIILAGAFRYDLLRYVRHSSSATPYRSRRNLQSRIIATYHNIEKGLSLPAPRPGFGSGVVDNLLDYLSIYVHRFGVDDTVVTAAGVLEQYIGFNRCAGLSEIPHERRIAHFLEDVGVVSKGVKAGTTEMNRATVLKAVDPVGIDFFELRSSVRHFSDEIVSLEDVRFAAIAAQKAPAVCNRQASKIHVFQDRKTIDTLLSIQGGARGFEDSIGSLAVISADLRNYWAVEERHQAWVDGGLVAMSFVLGLHARGLGSVCLNWSKSPSKNDELIKTLNLPPASAVIMMVAFGHLRERYSVATSARSSLSEFLILE